MKGLTLLIFSRNDIDKALGLIKELYETTDEIVLMDSSDKAQRKDLREKAKNLKKVRSFYTVPLGYPDPMRMYGLTKCRREWVLLLDTDEKLSEDLKKEVNGLINSTDADAFAIRRLEEASGQKAKGSYVTWQIRLFKKDRVSFSGLRHEQAVVKGKLLRLHDDKYYMSHLEEVRGSTDSESIKLRSFDERLSYQTYNKRFLEYLAKFSVPKGDVKETALGKFFMSSLLLYQRIGRKKPESEVSNLDYFALNMLKEIGFTLNGRPLGRMLDVIPYNVARIKTIKEWKASENARESFEISKIINRIGIIKFLDLDKESTIKRLNRLYKDKKKGIGLLVELLYEKYEKQNREHNKK